MKKPTWDIKSIESFTNKSKRTKEALKYTIKGQESNVIKLPGLFERRMFYNNKELYNSYIESKNKQA